MARNKPPPIGDAVAGVAAFSLRSTTATACGKQGRKMGTNLGTQGGLAATQLVVFIEEFALKKAMVEGAGFEPA